MARQFAVIVMMLAGCGGRPSQTARPAGGQPEIGAWGFDTAGMDTSVAPGADFYRYANGRWLACTQIPADKSVYAMFTLLDDRSVQRTRQILEAATGAPGRDGQRIGDYYKAFLDEAAIEARGIAPIQPRLDAIASIKDTGGVVLQFAASARQLGESPFHTTVTQDQREPEKYIANIAQGGLGLPDRDLYDTSAAQFEPVREAYKKYIAALFTLIGAPNTGERAAAVYAADPHSPAPFRASVVRNLDAWYDAFKPEPTDALYLPPDQRVKIW